MVLSGQGENTGIHSLLTCETSPELTYCNSCGQKQKILLFITNPAWLTTTHLLISRGKKWLNTLVLFSLVLSSFRPDDLLDPFRQFSVFSNREVVSCSEAALSSPPLQQSAHGCGGEDLEPYFPCVLGHPVFSTWDLPISRVRVLWVDLTQLFCLEPKPVLGSLAATFWGLKQRREQEPLSHWTQYQLSPQIHMLNPNPQWDSAGGWGLWEVIRS